MMRSAGVFLALAALGASLPASAGTVYIPILDAVNGSSPSTRVWITNSDSQSAKARVTFLVDDTNGMSRNNLPGNEVTVGAKSTLRLGDLGHGGHAGMLEIDLLNASYASAARHDHGAANDEANTDVPVVSSANMLSAGETTELIGLVNVAGQFDTQVGLMNLGTSAASCAVQIFRADGTQVGGTANIALQPLSVRHFTAGVDEPNFTEGRAQISCNQNFYAYASIVDGSGELDYFVTPAGSGRSTLELPGKAVEPGECPPAPAWCWQQQNNFTPTKANPILMIEVAPPTFAYSSLHATWRVTINEFNHVGPTGAHGLMWIVRDNNKGQILSAFARGGGRNTVTLRHGMNVPSSDKAKIEEPFKAVIGETYDFDYLYDPVNRKIVLTVSLHGEVVARLTDKPNVNKLHIDPGSKLRIGMSNSGAHPGNVEPASIGWVYRNLRIELLP